MGGHGITYKTAKSIIGNHELRNVTENRKRIERLFSELDHMPGDQVVLSPDGNGTMMTREAREKIDAVVDKIADDAYVRDIDAEQDYRDIRAATQGRYYLSEQDRHDIADFRARDSTVRVTSDRSATSVDSLYQDLAERFPHRFSADVTHPADQLSLINSTLSSLKGGGYRMSGEMLRETKNMLFAEINLYYAMTRG